METDVKQTYEKDIRIAEILAYSEIAPRKEAFRLRKLGHRISSVPYLRDIQFEKAKWHDRRANQDSDETRKALDEGDMSRVNELSDPDRKPYIPKKHELPAEARIPDILS